MANPDSKKHIRRYACSSWSGTSSVGIEQQHCVTIRLTHSIEYITNELHEILSSCKDSFNLRSLDMTKKFNHYTVLIYYVDKVLKEKSDLGYHTDCV